MDNLEFFILFKIRVFIYLTFALLFFGYSKKKMSSNPDKTLNFNLTPGP